MSSLSDSTKLEVLTLYQEMTYIAQMQTGFDLLERLLVMNVMAAELRFGRDHGATVASLSRACSRPYSTIDHRVTKLVEMGVLSKDDEGVVRLESDEVRNTWEFLVHEFVKRMAPVARKVAAEVEGSPSVPPPLPGSL